MVRAEVAPVLENYPGVSGVLHRPPDSDLERLIRDVRPDVLLNIDYHDAMIAITAKKAGVPVRVAKPRGVRQMLAATHIVWSRRKGSDRHESQHSLDFLKRLGWPVPGSIPSPPALVLTQEESAMGKADLRDFPPPRLGAIVLGKDIKVLPSQAWWSRMLEAARGAGWSPVVLSPADQGALPPTGLRGLMARLLACDAVLGVSTGPTHLSAALGVPTLCLFSRKLSRGPSRWAPLGTRAEALPHPGEKTKDASGMDRFSPDDVLARLDRLRLLGSG
jgi:hypothetical protein